MTDLVEAIERVRRETRGRGATRAVVLSRSYDATVEDLWEACTVAERLARWFERMHLAGDARAAPAEMERLTTSEEGAGLLRRAAASWVAAHTASGADPEVARAAAERTVAFYAGSAQSG